MENASVYLFFCLFGAVEVAFCSCSASDGVNEKDDVQTDDMTSDDSESEGDTGIDTDFPSPRVADTPASDDLAANPAACGQPDYAWLKNDSLGQITAYEIAGSYTKEALSEASTLTPSIELKYDVDTYLLTYTTQDRGEEIEATALVAWPSNVPDGETLPTMLFLHGTSGFTDGCGVADDPLYVDNFALPFASAGYITVQPDYIGLKSTSPETGFFHPYLVGQATAIASLDAVRTLGHLPAELMQGGARPSPKLLVFGASQGGHAALWVDRLAPYYARELDVLGVVATVPPADLLSEDTRELSLSIGFFGANASWYGADGDLDQLFVPPLDEDIASALAAGCYPLSALQSKPLEDVFQQTIIDAASDDTLADVSPWGCMLAENSLTTTSVERIQEDSESYGILFVLGESDETVHTATERAAYQTLCDNAPMQYLECAGASHVDTTFWAMPEILSFLEDRLSAQPFESSCTISDPVTCQGMP